MSLASGTRLGPYEILSLAGEGGMGQVYRARDTRLDRTVAIKTLPVNLNSDPDLRQRFEREARALSSLSHPHICTLYDVGQQEGFDYLVTEYLEGHTLAKRLEKGALPLDQALEYATQISDALDKAHRAGIVHRDIKPANIFITKSGVKVLDFGLAKTSAPVVATTNLSTLPTTSQNLTERGTILGTLQYMAPEQIEGQDVDARSDIFAFGAVFYEMLTGKKAFEGKTQASLIAAILEREPPPIAVMQPLTPPIVDRVVRTCLAKDPEDRWQSARDLTRELQWTVDSRPEATPQTLPTTKTRLGSSAAVVCLVFAVLVLAGLTYVYRTTSATPPVVRFAFSVPQSERFGDAAGLALSPDGSRLVFQAYNERGVPRLYVRSMDSLDSEPLNGTDGAVQPFFSPDGQWVGFFADRKLKKIPISGGSPIELCDAPNPRGGSWGADGTIVLTPNFPSGLSRVSANGGTPAPVTKLDSSLDRHNWPELLPGGKAVLFSRNATGDWAQAEIVSVSLDTGERRILIRGGSYARYLSPGYIVYARAGNIIAVRFDASRLEITGGAVPVVEGIQHTLVTGGAQFSVSQSGALAYVPGNLAQDRRTLTWVDRNGMPHALPPHPAQAYRDARLSPDGTRLVVSIGPGNQNDMWVFDLARGVLTRLTYDFQNVSPIWTVDGKRIVFWRRQQGGSLVWKAADGSGNEERLYEHDRANTTATALGSWSSDGRVLVFVLGDTAVGGADIWTFSPEGDRKPKPLIRTRFYEGEPALSPDARWLAYSSTSSGKSEVYVQPFPDLEGKWQISVDGGFAPAWASNGRELFYRSGNGEKMMVVDVRTQPSFQPQPARVLFERSDLAVPYDVAPDGQRFLMIKQGESAALSEAHVVLDWAQELKRRTEN